MLLSYIPLALVVIGAVYFAISVDKYDCNLDEPRLARAFGTTCLIFSAHCLAWLILIGFDVTVADWRWVPVCLFAMIVLTVIGVMFRRWPLDDEPTDIIYTNMEE